MLLINKEIQMIRHNNRFTVLRVFAHSACFASLRRSVSRDHGEQDVRVKTENSFIPAYDVKRESALIIIPKVLVSM
ncbi:hypothetical protein F2P81_024358 [Scophthalmus maximus]|uniref:Uncharacterized protein n=1 Tax=Scophthalmus maximus TaxID=52904 RepID=A0A6A4RUL6_SCOMX|nr:hypothetical protein F2P81_024358 [Scophthalmus maximus]